jgi:PHD/YefM family antitoxin component YafN of YafNO toxin-antitoxin module
MFRTIPASEIKRRGISVVDEMLCEGAVHVIKNDRPSYVILSEADFNELVDAQEQAYIARVEAALEDVAAGRTRKVTARQLIEEFHLDSDA